MGFPLFDENVSSLRQFAKSAADVVGRAFWWKKHRTLFRIVSVGTDLINSDDWGDPRGYDVTVNRKGQSLETEYTVQPSPHKELPAEIKAAFEAKKINLDALFEGQNPFDEADGPRSDEEVAASERAL